MITPLTSTIVDWRSYIEYVKETKGTNPIKCLDAKEIDLQNPLAIIYSLQEMCDSKSLFNLVQASFLVQVDILTVLDLLNLLSVKFIKLYTVSTTTNLVLYGGLADWKETVINLNESSNKGYLKIGTDIFYLFCSAGLKTLWSDCKISRESNLTVIAR